jgi:hypothetical protein
MVFSRKRRLKKQKEEGVEEAPSPDAPQADDTVEVVMSEALVEESRDTPLERPSVRPAARHERKAEAPPAPSSAYCRVERQAVFVANGSVITLHAGTVVSSATHDLAELKRQGVPLAPCDPPTIGGRDAYGRPVTAAYQEPR